MVIFRNWSDINRFKIFSYSQYQKHLETLHVEKRVIQKYIAVKETATKLIFQQTTFFPVFIIIIIIVIIIII